MQVRELNLILIKLVRFTNQKHEHGHDGSMARRAIRGHCARRAMQHGQQHQAACLVRARRGEGRHVACGAATKQAQGLQRPAHSTHNTHAAQGQLGCGYAMRMRKAWRATRVGEAWRASDGRAMACYAMRWAGRAGNARVLLGLSHDGLGASLGRLIELFFLNRLISWASYICINLG